MQHPLTVNRRVFLGKLAGGLAAAGYLGSVPGAWSAGTDGGKLVVRQQKPFNAESPLANLTDHWLTGNDSFFQRTHGTIPQLDLNSYRLTVEGLVERPVTLSLGELKDRFPSVDAAVTLTCAGNRRSEFPPEKKIGGVQWGAGAISSAQWQGVPLAAVLKHVGVQAEARHVWFDSLDEIVEGGQTISFGASIPLEKALAGTQYTPGALLAHTMNRQPLPADHGAPLRTVVPGYIGARSVKWLGKIVVSDRPTPNHYVSKVYKLVTTGSAEEVAAATPIYEHMLNSVICRWTVDAAANQLVVRGFALPSGRPECLIHKVELSLDDGSTWTPARITSPEREFCWAFWEAVLPASAIGKTALVKATDSQGESQPREMKFNFKGYQYNAWHGAALNS